MPEFYSLYGDVRSAIAQRSAKLAAQPVKNGSVATVDIFGILTRGGSDGTSSEQAAADINKFAADQSVSCIAIHVSSPGGAVAGTLELANEVVAAAAVKPVHVHIEDIGASAAYWGVCGATKIWANATAIVGSIGTFTVVVDSSALGQSIGLKTIAIKSGEFKAMGLPGTEITPAMLAEYQRTVDAIQSNFTAAVANGRKLSLPAAQQLADGRVHVGQNAVALKLVDGIVSRQSFRSQLAAAFSTSPQSKGSLMFMEQKKGPKSEQFFSEVESLIERGMSREKAIAATVANEPELHRAMIAEANADRR